MTSSDLIAHLHQYFDEKEMFLDSFIDSGSDHELFIASYIHGHFSVEAAKLLQLISQHETSINNKLLKLSIDDSPDHMLDQYKLHFQSMLNKSINAAIDNNELEKSDAQHVFSMLKRLFTGKRQ